MKAIALIPARHGSKRSPLKNIRLLNGHPLIAYTIQSALKSQIFEKVLVSTDSLETAEIALKYGATVPFMRPKEMAQDHSTDFKWIHHTLSELSSKHEFYDCFSILRPTSPFRTFQTIQRAWASFCSSKENIDSLRAVQLCSEHPAKMWSLDEEGIFMNPILKIKDDITIEPHSRPYQQLPKFYIQNASLEIAWTKIIFKSQSISGSRVKAFVTKDYEGVDINNEFDWYYIKYLLDEGKVELPKIIV